MAMLLLPRRRGGALLMTLQLAVTADAFAVPRSRSPLALPRRASLREGVAPDNDRKIVLKDGEPRIWFGGRGRLEGNPHFDMASPDPIEVWCDGSYDPRTESGGAGVVIPGDAGSGRWLMQAHIPTAFRNGVRTESTNIDAEWLAVQLGLNTLLWRFGFWSFWYQTEYGGRPPPPRQVRVFSDLDTLVETCDRWLSGEPVKEPSSEYIWSTFEVLQKLSDEGIDVTFEGVKSHSGLALHDLADRLAREASVVNEENLYGHYLPPGRLFLRYKSC